MWKSGGFRESSGAEPRWRSGVFRCRRFWRYLVLWAVPALKTKSGSGRFWCRRCRRTRFRSRYLDLHEVPERSGTDIEVRFQKHLEVRSQFRRDWNFSPALWNYLFRAMINLELNSTMYAVPQEDAAGRRVLTVLQSAEIQKGVQEIYTALQRGTYVDVNGDE